MISNVNEAELILNAFPLNVFKGNNLKTVEDTQNLTTRNRMASRGEFKIVSYNFHLNVK